MKGLQLALRSRDIGPRTPARLPPFRRKLLFEALEPRVLLSADLNPTHEALLDAAAIPLVRTVERDTPQVTYAANAAINAELEQQSRAIIFVDPTVASFQRIVEQLPDAANTAVFVLDGARDGVQQITEFLEGQHGVDAVHVLSHGSADGAALGNAILGGSTLDGYADQLAAWSDALSDDADILLYGCSVGADEGFLGKLAALTGADVAASNDPTGAASFGGDWDLESAIGAVQTAGLMLSYAGVLDATLSGNPTWEAQGPDGSAMPDVDAILGDLPAVVAGGGSEAGPTRIDATLPVNAGSPVNGMEAQGNPIAGAITSVAVSPNDPKVIFIGTVNGGVWVTRDATATKLVDLNTIFEPQRGAAPKAPEKDSVSAGGGLEAKTYEYKITFYDAESKTESNASEILKVTVGAAGSKVKLKSIEEGPDGTTQRFVYRREAGTDQMFRKIGEVANVGTPVESTFVDTGAALTDANKARTQQVLFPHWEPLTDGWSSLAITTLAFDVADPVLDRTTPLSAIPGGVHFIEVGAGYDLRATLRDGSVVQVNFKGAQRIDDLAAMLEVQGGYLASGLPKLSLTVEAGKRLVLTDNTQPFVVSPANGTAAADLGLTQLADATGKNIIGAARTVVLSGDTRLADIGTTGVRTAGAGTADLRINLRNGDHFDVDLSAVTSVQGLIGTLQALGGGNKLAVALLAGNKLLLEDKSGLVGGNTFSIAALNGSNAGADLGILVAPDAGGTKITGAARAVTLSAATRLSDLNGGTGVRSAGLGAADFTVHLNSGVAPFGVSLNAVVTVGDLVAKLNDIGGGGKVQASIGAGAQANRIVLKDLTTFASPLEVENPDGSTALADLKFNSAVVGGAKLVSDDLTVTLPKNQTIYAGTGTSSSSRSGGSPIGVLKSTDNGATWSLKGAETLAGLKIMSIATTFDTDNTGARTPVLLVGTLGGLFRSTNGGDSFERVSAIAGSNLPVGAITDVKAVRDPANPDTKTILFAAHVGSGAAFAGAGIYRSTNGGASWELITNNAGQSVVPSATAGTPFNFSAQPLKIQLAVHASGSGGTAKTALYAGVIGTDAQIKGVFRSGNPDAAHPDWIFVADQPGSRDLKDGVAQFNGLYMTGAQGDLHFSFFADRQNENVVYIGGSTQGSQNSSVHNPGLTARLFRLDASVNYALLGSVAAGQSRGSQLTDDGAIGPSPAIRSPDVAAAAAAAFVDAAPAAVLGNGTYKYKITYVDDAGRESNASDIVSVKIEGLDDATKTKVKLTGLPTGPVDVMSRNIYRLKLDGSGYFLAGTLANRSAAAGGFDASVFVDNKLDQDLGAQLAAGRDSLATAAGGGNLSAGIYHYQVTYVDSTGTESNPSEPIAVKVGANGEVTLNIPTGPAGTETRKIYRTLHDGAIYYYVATVQKNDPAPNVFVDDRADALLKRLARWNAAAPDITNGGGTAMGYTLATHATITTPVPDGVYFYKVSFVDAGGLESQLSNALRVEVAGGDAHRFVSLNNVPLGPEGTVKRLIYRTSAGGVDDYRLLPAALENNTARTFGEATLDAARGNPYNPRQLVGGAPHADSRFLLTDPAGNLLEADDGGLYRLTSPTGLPGERYWESLNGDLRISEIGGLEYDPINDIIFVGTQDNGSQQQNAPDSETWRLVGGGDGNTQGLGIKTSLDGSVRYYLENNFNYLYRREYGPNNNLISNTQVALAGLDATDKFQGFESNLPLAVNAVNPALLALGRNHLYESADKGGTVTDLSTVAGPAKVPPHAGKVTAIAYGGREGGAAKEKVMYVAATSQIMVRDANGVWGSAVQVGTGEIQQVVMDPDNWRIAYAVDASHVYVTTDGGANWADITGAPGATGSLPANAMQTVALAKVPAKDLRVTLHDGSTFDVSLKAALTIEQIRSAIEVQSRATPTGAKRLTVTFDVASGKLSLKDGTAILGGTHALTIEALYDSTAGADLGIIGATAGDTLQGSALAAPVIGTTRLADIGAGGVSLAKGASGKHLHITLSDGTTTFDVDLTGATTVAQVIDKIQVQSRTTADDPATARVQVTLGADSKLVLTDKTALAGTGFAVEDLAGSDAGAGLHIADVAAVGKTITGTTLTTVLHDQTPLATLNGGAGVRAFAGKDVLLVGGAAGVYRAFNPVGTPGSADYGRAIVAPHSSAIVVSPGENNDLRFTAKGIGSKLDGVLIRYVDSGGADASVNYDRAAGTLVFRVKPDTKAEKVIELARANAEINADWDVQLDPGERGGNTGQGAVAPFLSSTTGTITTAAQKVKVTEATLLKDLGPAGGVRIKGGGAADFEITLSDPNQHFNVSLDGLAAAGTLADVIARIQQASKVDAGSPVRVTGAVTDGRLVITEVNPSGAERLKIAPKNSSSAAGDLGIHATAPLAKPAQITGVGLAARLSDDTRLDALNNGGGVRSAGGELVDFTIQLRDAKRVEVSVAGAATVKDLNARIEAVTASKVTLKAGNGADLGKLILADTTPGASLFVLFGANGSLAAEDLGVAAGLAFTAGGGKPTLGANATARVASEGPKNDLVFTALRPGAAYNDFTVRFVAQTAGVTVPTLVYDANARTLEFRIIAGTTKASDIKALLANDPLARFDFKADFEGSEAGNNGSGTVQVDATGTTAGGTEMLRWTEFGGELPNAPVMRIDYTPAMKGGTLGDVLVVGTKGRGAFKLEDAAAKLNQPSVLEVTGNADANAITLRQSSDGQNRVEVYVDGHLVGTYAMSSIDRIQVQGLGGNDTLTLDSRLRVPGGITFDGGEGDNTLTLPGAPGTAVLKLTSQGQGGSVVIGGTSVSTLNVEFSHVAFLQPIAAGDPFLQARAGLAALAASQQLNAAFAQKPTALGGGAITRVLGGAPFNEIRPVGSPGVLGAEPEEAEEEEEEAAAGASTESIIARLLESGLGGFRIEDIGSEEIPDFAALRQALDDLDEIEDNVVLTEAGGVTLFDVRVEKDVDGAADLDINALGGAVTLRGNVDLEAEIKLHLVFGVDDQGFFIDTTAAGEPELTVNHLHVHGEVSAAGHIGLVDLRLDEMEIDVDPSVSIALDIAHDGGILRLQDFGDLLDALHVEVSGGDGPDLTLTAEAELGVAGFSLGETEIELSWADISDPFSITLGDMPLIETLQTQLASLLRSGVQQLDGVGAFLDTLPGLNTELPLIGKSVADLLPVGTILQLGDAVADYLDDPDPSSEGVELATMAGLTDALATALRAALGAGVQGELVTGPFSVNGGYFADSNELRFDFALDANYEDTFTLDGSDIGGAATALGLDFDTELGVRAGLTAAFSIGLDLSKLSTPGEAFFVRLSDPLTASLQVSANDIDVAVDLGGFANLGIEDGQLDLAALLALALADPNGDGRTTFNELTDTPFAELFELTAEAELSAELPLTGSFGGFDLTRFGSPTILISAPDLIAGAVPDLTFNAPEITFDIYLDDAEVQQNILQLLDDLREEGFGSLAFLDAELPVVGKSINDLLGAAIGDLLDLHGAFASYFDSHLEGGVNEGERANVSGAIDWVIDYMIEHLQGQLAGEGEDGPFQMSGGFDLPSRELRFDVAFDLSHTQDLDFDIADLVPVDFVSLSGSSDAELEASLTGGFGIAVDLGEIFDSLQDAVAFTFAPLNLHADLRARNIDVTASVGPIAGGVDGGELDLAFEATLEIEDPSGDGVVTLRELTDDFVSLVDFSANASVDAELPLAFSVGPLGTVTDYFTPTVFISSPHLISVTTTASGPTFDFNAPEVSVSILLDNADVQENILELLQALKNMLSGLDFMAEDLPLLDKSLNDLIGGDLGELLDLHGVVQAYFDSYKPGGENYDPSGEARANLVGLIDWAADALADAVNALFSGDGAGPLTLSGGFDLGTQTLSFDFDFATDFDYSFEFDLDQQIRSVIGFDPSDLGLAVDAEALLELNAAADLHFGFDLDLSDFLGVGPQFSFDADTGFHAEVTGTASDIGFEVGLDLAGVTLGLIVDEGSAEVHLEVDVGLGGMADEPGDDGRVTFAELGDAFAAEASGSASIDLPLYFPIKALPVGGTTKDRNDDDIADNVLHAEASFLLDTSLELETAFDVITPEFGTGFDAAAALIALLNDPGNLLQGLEGFFSGLDTFANGIDSIELPLIGGAPFDDLAGEPARHPYRGARRPRPARTTATASASGCRTRTATPTPRA